MLSGPTWLSRTRSGYGFMSTNSSGSHGDSVSSRGRHVPVGQQNVGPVLVLDTLVAGENHKLLSQVDWLLHCDSAACCLYTVAASSTVCSILCWVVLGFLVLSDTGSFYNINRKLHDSN